MSKKKPTPEQQTYMKSMNGWFDSMDLNRQIHETELAHWNKTIELAKKKIVLNKAELSHINTRTAIAKKEYAIWQKQNIK